MSKKDNGVNYTNDWLPIKMISNGYIQTTDGYYVAGVKVLPKNIFIMDNGLRDSIINNLMNFYNTLDFEFWLYITDRPVDLDVYLANLQLMYNNATDNRMKKLIIQDINKANMFMNEDYNVVDTEYYFLFKDKKLEVIQKRIRSIISNLTNAQLSSVQASNDDLRMILDGFLNGGYKTTFGTVV